MRQYWSIIKGSILGIMAYRSGFIFTILNNIIYMVIAFFLWRNIYQGKEILRGMTFNQTFMYVTIASSLIILLKTWTDWEISYHITEGSIITYLIKPVRLQLYMMSQSFGFMLVNLATIIIPSLIFLIFIFKIEFKLGPGLLFFPLALLLSFLMNTTIDFIIGMTSFYTESIWGISSTKDIIITFLSGSLIPLQFFPETIQGILKLLPFQAMYHLPLMMLTEPNQPVAELLAMLGIQVFWLAVIVLISRVFYNRAIKVLRVSGG